MSRGGAVALVAASGLLATLSLLGAGCDGCQKSSIASNDAATLGSDAGLVAESTSPPPTAPSVVSAALNPGSLPVYTGPTATLEGNVYVRGEVAPELEAPARSSCQNVRDYRLFREGPADASGRRALADAVVGVTGYQGSYVPPNGDAVSVQVKDCAFDRRTVVLTFGQRLDVINTEPLNSGVFYAPKLMKDTTSTQMIAAPGNTVKLYVQKPGRDLLVDGMGHGHLYADVFAALHSLHVVTDSAGHFVLPGIPVGELDATAMHPAFDLGGVHAKLVFKAGETTHHDFELTYAPAAKGDAGAADAGKRNAPR